MAAMETTEFTLDGHGGTVVGRRWTDGTPAYVVLLVHGYGEHVGRYDHVAERLVADGGAVYGNDHVGHGRSEGERVVITDLDPVVDDVHAVADLARSEHAGLPVVLVGHSMGGLIAARYAQRYGDELACVVLSGPVLGRWAAVDDLLEADPIPDTPIDPDTLSRDPAVGEAYVADPLVWHGPFRRPTLRALADGLARVTEAGAVDVPVLWLHGEEDTLVPIEDTRTGWATFAGANASARSYPGARHEIFNETSREAVLDDVVAFVRAHLPS